MATPRWEVKRGPWPDHGIEPTPPGLPEGLAPIAGSTDWEIPPGASPDGPVARAARAINAGERIDFDTAVGLFRSNEVLPLAKLANRERERRHGARTYFNRNLHLNPSNVCVETCRFCAFARRRIEADGAWRMTLEQAWEKVVRDGQPPKTEVHIVGGLDPDLPFDYYLELLRGIKERTPHLHIKAFTAVEIDFFCELTGKDHRWVLEQLVDAGLGSLPGGGVEMFSERVRDLLTVRKGSGEAWLKTHHIAHELGLWTNATMLYGHVETLEERVDHLFTLRAAQDADLDKPARWRTFIPLAFHPGNSGLRMLPGPTGLDALRTYAVSRLVLDNVPHIKCYWIQVGPKIAQASLWWGCDDIDGTITEETIYHMAGSRSPDMLTRDELVTLIRRAGRVPVERGTLYEIIEDDCIPAGASSEPAGISDDPAASADDRSA